MYKRQLIGYLIGFYLTLSTDIHISQLYLPTICRGFAYAVLSATFMVCLEEIMTFQHFFQGLSVFNMLHMVAVSYTHLNRQKHSGGTAAGKHYPHQRKQQ